MERDEWIDSLEFHAPCMIKNGSLDQLESRVENGFVPEIMMTSPLTLDEITRVGEYLRSNDVEGVSFNIQQMEHNKPLEGLLDVIVYALHTFSDVFIPEVSTKFGPTHGNASPGTHVSFDLKTHNQMLNQKIMVMHRYAVEANKVGLHLTIENSGRPNFSSGQGIPEPDGGPRWEGYWSAVPTVRGMVGCQAQEIAELIGALTTFGASLQLDVEHLVQTTQYGNIFNLSEGPLKHFGDLTDHERMVARDLYFVDGKDEDVLFDYRNLSSDETQFLQQWGYVFRQGQPLVTNEGLTLTSELARLEEVRIGTVTPGFQVYQGFWDQRGRQKEYIIGSHLPGVTEQYVKSPIIRRMLKDQIRVIHTYVSEFMREQGITSIELEAHVDDGSQVVYSGPSWDAQFAEMKRQMMDNFENPSLGIESPFLQTPYYLL